MITRHGNIDTFVIRVTATLDIAHAAKGNMCRVVILFTTRSFTRVTTNTVIRRKVESMLFITVRVITYRFIFINIH